LYFHRPIDPFRYLAHFIRAEGPNIADEIERARKLAAARKAARDKAKADADEADRLAREEAEAAAKALRDREAAKLAAAAARKAAEDAKKQEILKLQQSAAKAAAVATDAIEIPIPKAGKKKKAPPARQLPNKPSWQK
jgi:colicin import membrane protein